MNQIKYSLLSGLCSLLMAGALISGCASTPKNHTTRTPKKNQALQIQMPAPGKSKVVFIRPGSFAFAFKFSVHDGEKLIGTTSANSYFVYECDPGYHLFSTSMENTSVLDANLLPDRIYYVRTAAAMGVVFAEVNMISLHPDSAGKYWQKLAKILPHLHETVASSEAIERDSRGADNYWIRVQKFYKDRYLKNPKRDQILPDYGQLKPIGAQ